MIKTSLDFNEILINGEELNLDADKCYLGLFNSDNNNWILGRRFLNKYYVVFN